MPVGFWALRCCIDASWLAGDEMTLLGMSDDLVSVKCYNRQ